MELVRNQTLARLLFWLRHKKDVHKTAFTFSNENWKSKAEAASLVPNYHDITGTASNLWASHKTAGQLGTEGIRDPF